MSDQGIHGTPENDESPRSSTTASDTEDGRDSSGSTVDHRLVTQRAEGRPPEEASSDNPEEQAAAILEESAERTEQGASRSG